MHANFSQSHIGYNKEEIIQNFAELQTGANMMFLKINHRGA